MEYCEDVKLAVPIAFSLQLQYKIHYAASFMGLPDQSSVYKFAQYLAQNADLRGEFLDEMKNSTWTEECIA